MHKYMSLPTAPGYVNKFNSLSSVSLINAPAVSDIVSLMSAFILNLMTLHFSVCG